MSGWNSGIRNELGVQWSPINQVAAAQYQQFFAGPTINLQVQPPPSHFQAHFQALRMPYLHPGPPGSRPPMAYSRTPMPYLHPRPG